MEFDEVISKRRSIRKYLSIPVEKEKWTAVIQAGAKAPSSGNLQVWRVLIVTDDHNREQVARICHEQQWMVQAPMHFVICADIEQETQFYGKRGEMLYAIQDCAAMAENMLLKAVDVGLGGCWVSAFDEERLRVFFGMPQTVRPQLVVTIGYPDEEVPEPSKMYLKDICFFESYGMPWPKGGKALKFWDFSTVREEYHKDVNKFWKGVSQQIGKKLSKKKK